MINNQLLGYIKQQLSINISREVIVNNLKSQGWTDADLNEAFLAIGSVTPPTPIPVSPIVSPMAPKVVKSNKVLLIVLMLILLGGGSAVGYFFYLKPNIVKSIVVPDTENTVENQEVNQTSSQASTISNPDIERVKIILEDIRQGFLTGNKDLIIKHSSVETASFFSSSEGKLSIVNEFTVNEITQSGTNILADINSSESTMNGPMIFIKEAGDWKLDMTATLKYSADQNNAKKGTGDPNGLPDLIVTSVIVYPSHPLVNNKDVQVAVTIKNIGTKTSDNGAPLVATLIGFTKETPVQGGALYPITPGETVTWDFNPYKNNDVFKVSDTPGQKTIQIVLNKYHDVIESNYDNNIFTQKVEVFSK